MKNILILLGCMLAAACQAPKNQITKAEDYSKYINVKTANPKLELLQKELSFWTEKYEKDNAQYPFLLKMAAANAGLFEINANIENLNTAITQLELANEKTNHTMASILRSMAKNYITHHKFTEATKALKEAQTLGENRAATEKMLFDVYMETGNYTEAKTILDKLSKKIDFDYQIRLAKWLDYKGQTPKAVEQLRIAAMMAETDKNEDLKLWAYSNLGDFYGHTGNIEKAYTYYLKTLAIDPHYTYALKGIAWIAFSHEKNTKEASRIVSYLEKVHPSPDYILLRSQMAAFDKNTSLTNALEQNFIAATSTPAYAGMYDAYLIKMLENEPEKAKMLAQNEVKNRPTAVSYELLASAYAMENNGTKALEIVETKVLNATFEPKSLLGAAKIYKLNKQSEQVAILKKELLEAGFELGPVLKQEIIAL
jgi:tetratricopeptide (TPR) repeat protein